MLAIAANAGLFLTGAFLIVRTRADTKLRLALFAAMAAWVFLIGLFLAGFQFSRIDIWPLAIGTLFYGAFVLVTETAVRLSRGQQAGGTSTRQDTSTTT